MTLTVSKDPTTPVRSLDHVTGASAWSEPGRVLANGQSAPAASAYSAMPLSAAAFLELVGWVKACYPVPIPAAGPVTFKATLEMLPGTSDARFKSTVSRWTTELLVWRAWRAVVGFERHADGRLHAETLVATPFRDYLRRTWPGDIVVRPVVDDFGFAYALKVYLLEGDDGLEFFPEKWPVRAAVPVSIGPRQIALLRRRLHPERERVRLFPCREGRPPVARELAEFFLCEHGPNPESRVLAAAIEAGDFSMRTWRRVRARFEFPSMLGRGPRGRFTSLAA